MLLTAVSLVILANAGCFLNEYQSNPVDRMQTLMYESENLRQCQGEIDRFWMVDQPSHLTPDRTHGGVRSEVHY
jgi:hypothetical protein